MIVVAFRPQLAVSRGKLIAVGQRGTEVHAATYLRRGLIVLDSALLREPRELKRIFLHELFHFVWWKLSNARRTEWQRVLVAEFARRVRGELGWSAESRKKKLSPRDIASGTRLWRDYRCESFCDTGASLLMKVQQHPEWTLARKFRTIRLNWLGDIIRSEEDLVHLIDPKLGWLGFDLPADLSRLFPAAPSLRGVPDGVEEA